ncbi:uncharacterized protein EI90DRAFT_3020248 [Cantharellus anzutake]|uniref:uncharacterized protein n=1 Tax=Cantharellus anzutake TaxID=1750568 RepID=UPI001905EF12|nr:uncharacterized protein EI90DRAFT_3020248 [Cantharellus anzutake]KAF8321465.1 hypothetical protein EI90DRAFT_3020248 [Cantharellus anzutake]
MHQFNSGHHRPFTVAEDNVPFDVLYGASLAPQEREYRVVNDRFRETSANMAPWPPVPGNLPPYPQYEDLPVHKHQHVYGSFAPAASEVPMPDIVPEQLVVPRPAPVTRD